MSSSIWLLSLMICELDFRLLYRAEINVSQNWRFIRIRKFSVSFACFFSADFIENHQHSLTWLIWTVRGKKMKQMQVHLDQIINRNVKDYL